jgi:hypothetical protein
MGVVGDVGMEIGAVRLNHYPVLTQNYRHLCDRFASPAPQKRLDFVVRRVAFVRHIAFRSLDIACSTCEQALGDLAHLSLVQSGSDCLLVSILGGLSPGPGRPVIAEHLLCVVVGLLSLFLVKLLLLRQ